MGNIYEMLIHGIVLQGLKQSVDRRLLNYSCIWMSCASYDEHALHENAHAPAHADVVIPKRLKAGRRITTFLPPSQMPLVLPERSDRYVPWPGIVASLPLLDTT